MTIADCKRILTVSTMLLLLVSTLAADQSEQLVLDIETAVELALLNNLGLRSERLDTAIALRNHQHRYNVFIPNIAAQASWSRPNNAPEPSPLNPGDDPARWNFGAGASASLTLSAQMIQGIRQVADQLHNAEIGLAEAERRVEMEVRKAFYQLLLLQEQQQLAQRRLAAAEDRLAEIRANYNAGLVDELTLRRTQVGVAAQRPALLHQQQAVKNATRSLAASLGVADPESLRITGSISAAVVELKTRQQLLALAAQSSDLQAVQRGRDSLEIGIAATRASLLPTLTLSWGVSPSLDRNSDPFSGDFFETANYSDRGSFSLTVRQAIDPLLPGSRTRQKLANQRDQLSGLELQQQQVRQAVELQLHRLVGTINAGRQTLSSLEGNLALAKRAFELAEEAYNSGLRDYSVVRDAEIDLDDARVQLLQERHRYLEALLDLENLLNTPLDELKEKQ